ncbi:MAG: hypothetical protein RBU37_23755 [Myxococcota bacterium]|jgi:hypothetical protein|nr:hypothetical protein [Myxococcota bacterium]
MSSVAYWSAERWRLPGLEVYAEPEFDPIDLGDGYAAAFALLGTRILLTAPIGEAGEHGVPRFCAARQRFLEKHGLWDQTHVELKDYSRMGPTPSRRAQNQFVDFVKAEFERGALVGLFSFGTRTIVRWIFNANLKLHGRTEQVFVYSDFDEAVERAQRELRALGLSS